MTIIDTTLYCNGALRLSRHGKGRGGNILVHVATGEQFHLSDEGVERIDTVIRNLRTNTPFNRYTEADPVTVWRHMQNWFTERA